MVGFLVLLVNVATTREMNSSLLDQIEEARSKLQISRESGVNCVEDLKLKNMEIKRKLNELENIKIKNIKESNEQEKKKVNLD